MIITDEKIIQARLLDNHKVNKMAKKNGFSHIFLLNDFIRTS